MTLNVISGSHDACMQLVLACLGVFAIHGWQMAEKHPHCFISPFWVKGVLQPHFQGVQRTFPAQQARSHLPCPHPPISKQGVQSQPSPLFVCPGARRLWSQALCCKYCALSFIFVSKCNPTSRVMQRSPNSFVTALHRKKGSWFSRAAWEEIKPAGQGQPCFDKGGGTAMPFCPKQQRATWSKICTPLTQTTRNKTQHKPN